MYCIQMLHPPTLLSRTTSVHQICVNFTTKALVLKVWYFHCFTINTLLSNILIVIFMFPYLKIPSINVICLSMLLFCFVFTRNWPLFQPSNSCLLDLSLSCMILAPKLAVQTPGNGLCKSHDVNIHLTLHRNLFYLMCIWCI